MRFETISSRKEDSEKLQSLISECQSILKRNKKQNKRMNRSASSLVFQHNRLITRVKRYRKELEEENVELSP